MHKVGPTDDGKSGIGGYTHPSAIAGLRGTLGENLASPVDWEYLRSYLDSEYHPIYSKERQELQNHIAEAFVYAGRRNPKKFEEKGNVLQALESLQSPNLDPGNSILSNNQNSMNGPGGFHFHGPMQDSKLVTESSPHPGNDNLMKKEFSRSYEPDKHIITPPKMLGSCEEGREDEDTSRKTQWIVLMAGPIASGKTTVRNHLLNQGLLPLNDPGKNI